MKKGQTPNVVGEWGSSGSSNQNPIDGEVLRPNILVYESCRGWGKSSEKSMKGMVRIR